MPDLTAETLAKLQEDEGAMSECGDDDNAAKYAHAAACVRRVPEIDEEVERLRAENLLLLMERVDLLECKAFVAALDAGEIAVRRYSGGTIELAKDAGGVAYHYFSGPDCLAAFRAATQDPHTGGGDGQ